MRSPITDESASKSARQVSADDSKSARAGLGAKRGDSGGSGTDLRSTALYKALVEIGTKEKTIRHTSLFHYPAVLNAPAVLKRCRPNPTVGEKALAAEQAIQEAIKAIVVPTDRRIALAAMAAAPDFVGKRVTQRKQTLLDDYHITSDMYKAARPVVLEKIVEFLSLSTVPPAPPSFTAAPADQHASSPAGDYNHLEAFLRIHFAGLAALFTWNCDAELSAKGYGILRYEPNACAAELFDAYAWFATYGAPRIASDLGGRVTELANAICAASPCSPDDGPTLKATADFNLDEIVDMPSPGAELFEGVWLPWYHGIGKISTGGDSVQAMTASAGMAARILGSNPLEHIEQGYQVGGIVGCYYRYEVLPTAFARYPVVFHAQDWAVNASEMLANGEIVWQNK